jgi:hypothetical protein
MRWLGCLALAALLASPAWAADEKKDKKEKEKKEAPKKEQKDDLDVPIPDLGKLLEGLGGGLDEEELKLFRQQMDRVREALKQMQKGRGGLGGLPMFPAPGRGGLGAPMFPPLGGGGLPARGTSVQEARLGAKLSEPTPALVDQLDLPKGQGLVLEEVGANSAAAKAGLKANDIILELNGKAVSRKKEDFEKALAEVGADKAVDVVVMRKGRKETLKGLKLPDAKAAARR